MVEENPDENTVTLFIFKVFLLNIIMLKRNMDKDNRSPNQTLH